MTNERPEIGACMGCPCHDECAKESWKDTVDENVLPGSVRCNMLRRQKGLVEL